jgi:hypothetical protein
MRKQNAVWILFSPTVYSELQKNAGKDKEYSTITKYVMHIVQNYKPQRLLEDYTYHVQTRKTSIVAMNNAEYKMVADAAEKEGIVPGRYIRNLVFTFFKERGYI